MIPKILFFVFLSTTLLTTSCADQKTLLSDKDVQDCETPGGICDGGLGDFLIYVGLSPEDHEPIYTTRCDAGMSWDKKTSQCIGEPDTKDWAFNAAIAKDLDEKLKDTFNIKSIPDCDLEKPDMNSEGCKSGKSNTEKLAFADSLPYPGNQPHMAAQYCNSMTRKMISGDTGSWYLPSIAELAMLYKIKDTPALKGTFKKIDWAEDYYWSSSEADDMTAWAQSFDSDPQIEVYNKLVSLRIRCFYKDFYLK